MRATPLFPSLVLAFLVTACAGVPAGSRMAPPSQAGSPSPPRQRVSGIIGITEVTDLGLSLDSEVGDSDADDLSLPLIGAQVQFPSGGDRVEWGLEGGFSLGWESERDAVAIDTGVVLVSADNDLRIFDLSGGLYVGAMLGERARIYGGAGPLLQFARVDLEFDEEINGTDSLTENGIGIGYYTRAGIEFALRKGTMVGLGVRWVDSSVDLGSKLEKLELEAVQVALTVTTGF